MMSSGGIGVPLGFPLGSTSVIQITNLSSAVTSEQMRTLFSFLGDIEELRLYPPDNAPLTFSSKVCYIKFREATSVGVAQHLTNTVFIDRALIVVPCAEGKIPDEAKALSLLAPAPTMTSLMPGAGLLPIPTPTPLTTVVSKAHSRFNSPIWAVHKSEGEWRLTVDYRALNEVIPLLSAAVLGMLKLQYKLESKAATWYTTIDISNAFFSIPLAAECRSQFAFTWRGVQYTWNRLPQGWKHSPTVWHGLIQTALEKGEAPEHLQYIDDIIVWGNTAAEVFEKGEKIIQILLKSSFAIKKSKVKGPA
ncbi:hypothetical protein TURU_082117 [Turdus rufiventris]|nr:hypothetical protein TURU_082117 [Turdus rufiventris]